MPRMSCRLAAVLISIVPVAWAQPGAALEKSEEARRAIELKIPQVVEALGLSSGAKVADIGAGSGFYENALSGAVGSEGRVYAEDIDENGAIKHLKERVAKDRLNNVEVVLGTADDPKLPQGALDGVLMVIMYHEIANPQKILEHVKAALKPGGRLVIVDMAPHKT